MKTKFLVIILLVLGATVSAVSLVHFHFFKHERMDLVDRQIEQSAALLYSSDFAYRRIVDRDETDERISEILGRPSISLVVMLRDLDGKLIFQNDNAELFSAALASAEGTLPHESATKRWQLIQNGEYAIRLLTLVLPKRQKILEVGMVLNEDLWAWKRLNRHIGAYVAGILFCVTLISFFLRSLLLRPLIRLAEYLQYLSSHLDSPSDARPPRIALDGTDEFAQLARAAQELSQRLLNYVQATRRWTAQMAHELKTPITLLRAELETRGERTDALSELDRMARVVDDFLGWTSAETPGAGAADIHSIRLVPFLESTVQGFETLYPGRLSFSAPETAKRRSVLANPLHLQQVVHNLIVNAIKYSPTTEPVAVEFKNHRISIADRGFGIPAEVLRHLGTPFNRGTTQADQPGTGLGLAWVSTICRRYDWDLDVRTDLSGTEISITFPS